MKFKIQYKYVQGKINTFRVVECDRIEEAEALAEKLFNPDGWDHFTHVDPVPDSWDVTMDMDGKDIPKQPPPTLPEKFRTNNPDLDRPF